MIATLTHLPLPLQVTGAVLGTAALAAGAAWAVRAAVRYVTARGGQNWETVLLLGFFAAAASLSADGLIGFASNNMKLHQPFPVVFWLALDGAAGMLLSMVRRRARADRSTWHVRVVVWLIIAASADFNWTHAPALPGARLAFAAMPVVAGVLAELAVADIRQEKREQDRDGSAPLRRVEWTRWLHPVEMIRVMSLMAADAAVAATDATRDVRADAAARSLYRLRLAKENATADRGWLAVRFAEFFARAAFRRAGFATSEFPEDILRRVQVMVRLGDFASLDYGNSEAAQNAIGTLIDGAKPEFEPSGPATSPKTGRPALTLAASGPKETRAREFWDAQMTAGIGADKITGPMINEAAGATENSSFGRQFKNRMLSEMNAAADDGPAGDGTEVTG